MEPGHAEMRQYVILYISLFYTRLQTTPDFIYLILQMAQLMLPLVRHTMSTNGDQGMESSTIYDDNKKIIKLFVIAIGQVPG